VLIMRTAFACFAFAVGGCLTFAVFVFGLPIPTDRLPHTTVHFTGGTAINAAVLVGSLLGGGVLFIAFGLVALNAGRD
jgi:hypothetical protein